MGLCTVLLATPPVKIVLEMRRTVAKSRETPNLSLIRSFGCWLCPSMQAHITTLDVHLCAISRYAVSFLSLDLCLLSERPTHSRRLLAIRANTASVHQYWINSALFMLLSDRYTCIAFLIVPPKNRAGDPTIVFTDASCG